VSKSTSTYPSLSAEATSTSIVSHAGAALLLRTADKTGLTSRLSEALTPWRKPLAVHDPGKTMLDLAVAVALGGDCLADIAVLREQPAVFGPVASDPTVSRTITELARSPRKALRAIDKATTASRSAAWSLAGTAAPDHGADARSPLVIDIDATLVTAHSEKEQAAPTYKKGFGFHPLLAFIDHGPDGGGEPGAGLLRPGNAGANTAADHITVINQALAGLPGAGRYWVGKKVLIRMDGAGGTKTTLQHCVRRGLSYSAGFTLTEPLAALIDQIPATAWDPAYNADGQPREGAWVVELTHMADLTGWPDGMRLIVRKERPHPGAQLRITDRDGHRLTAFVTNTRGGQLADLELRHRQRARCEDRIRAGKQTGLAGFPFKHFAQNQIWLAIVSLAAALTAWTQLLALTGHPARKWEPKRLRLRLFSIAARITRHARRTRLRLSASAPWSAVIVAAIDRLTALPTPT